MKLKALIWISLFFILSSGIILAEDPPTKRLYTTKDSDKGRIYVIGDKEYGPYQNCGSVAFSPDGSKWVLSVWKDGKPYVNYNGKEIGPFDSVKDMNNIKLSDDGNTWYSFANSDQAQYIILNGKTYGPYQWISGGDITFNGKSWIFTACKSQDKDFVVVVNEKEYGPYRNINSAQMTSDGARWGFAAQKNSNSVVVIDGKEYGPFSNDGMGSVFYFSSDGKNWAIEADKRLGKNNVRVVVVNEKEYYGDSLRYVKQDKTEYFSWITYDETSALLNTLKIK